jgi:hypothetical protein
MAKPISEVRRKRERGATVMVSEWQTLVSTFQSSLKATKCGWYHGQN